MTVAAQNRASASTQRALESFCRAYWPPLYAFLRRRGHAPSDAQDLVQGFFANLLEQDTLSRANRESGKLRTYLLRSLQYFLANEYDRTRTIKRGGAQQIIPMDENAAEVEAALVDTAPLSAADCYDQIWASQIVDRAWEHLREEYAAAGKAQTLEALEPFLVGGPIPAPSQEQAAAHLHISPAALRKLLLNVRRRYREVLRFEVAQTVADPAEIDEELQYLYRLLLA